jgi:hypothetical protein
LHGLDLANWQKNASPPHADFTTPQTKPRVPSANDNRKLSENIAIGLYRDLSTIDDGRKMGEF